MYVIFVDVNFTVDSEARRPIAQSGQRETNTIVTNVFVACSFGCRFRESMLFELGSDEEFSSLSAIKISMNAHLLPMLQNLCMPCSADRLPSCHVACQCRGGCFARFPNKKGIVKQEKR